MNEKLAPNFSLAPHDGKNFSLRGGYAARRSAMTEAERRADDRAWAQWFLDVTDPEVCEHVAGMNAEDQSDLAAQP